jgi:hypothetical protein
MDRGLRPGPISRYGCFSSYQRLATGDAKRAARLSAAHGAHAPINDFNGIDGSAASAGSRFPPPAMIRRAAM